MAYKRSRTTRSKKKCAHGTENTQVRPSTSSIFYYSTKFLPGTEITDKAGRNGIVKSHSIRPVAGSMEKRLVVNVTMDGSKGISQFNPENLTVSFV